MAITIRRHFKSLSGPYIETLVFATPEEVNISSKDSRLIEIEGYIGKWFWMSSVNHRTTYQDFLCDEIASEDKNWNPFTHPLEIGTEEITEEEFSKLTNGGA